jgi:hypothetical protein
LCEIRKVEYCVITVITAKTYHKGEQKRNRGSPLHNEGRRGLENLTEM